MNAKFDKYTNQARVSTPIVQRNDHPDNTIPWWMRAVTCFSCKEVYYLAKGELDKYFITKVGKGFMQTICLLFKNGPTCMRFIETYSEILRMNFYDGVFEVNFVCQEVIPLC